jgi:hypothetical protein
MTDDVVIGWSILRLKCVREEAELLNRTMRMKMIRRAIEAWLIFMKSFIVFLIA